MTEIVCGILIMLGLFTRFAAVPMIIDMVVAITTTKIPLFLGTSSLPPAPVPPQVGFAAVLNEVTSEFPQLGSIFLLIRGAGPWSVDALRARARGAASALEQTGERPRAGVSSSTLKRLVDWFLNPPVGASPAVLLIRLGGAVLIWEGILKFIYPLSLGVKRFALIGIPFPDFMSPFDGAVEIVCGTLLALGLLTRLAIIPVLIDIGVAVVSTKITLLLGISALPPAAAPPQDGIWGMLHAIRADYALLLYSVFLLVVGPGRWSVDALLARSKGTTARPVEPMNRQPEPGAMRI